MKKIAKLSLVAAVAVAGLTNVNAASLEEAIKGVDVSGQFRFRAQDKSDNTGTNTDSNANGSDVEIEVGVKVPVTENVTAVFKIDFAGDKDDSNTAKDGVNIEDYYFSYSNAGTTVNFGQQNIPGRLTDAPQGDGIVALQQVGAFTVGAAGFMNNTVTNDADLYSVLAMGNLGPVALSAQYADLEEVSKGWNITADASLGMVKVGAEYSEKELENGDDDYSTAKGYISGKAGILSAKASYTKTGDMGSGSLDGELEAAAETFLWNIGSAGIKDSTNGRADADFFVVDASVAVTDKISLRAAILDGEQGSSDIQETLGQISYKVAKNLNTYFRYADVEDQGKEYQRGRIEVKYSF